MRYIVFDIESTSRNGFTAGRVNVDEQELTIIALYDSESNSYSSYLRDELPKLWPILERTDLLIGYNSNFFDIPLLNRYYPGDLTNIRSLDLMAEVQKVLGRRVRLQSLAQATLGKSKKGDGSKAMEWWAEGKIDKVREYCIEDVRITKEIFDYALEKGELKYIDLREKKTMKLDTSAWMQGGEAPSLTHAFQL